MALKPRKFKAETTHAEAKIESLPDWAKESNLGTYCLRIVTKPTDFNSAGDVLFFYPSAQRNLGVVTLRFDGDAMLAIVPAKANGEHCVWHPFRHIGTMIGANSDHSIYRLTRMEQSLFRGVCIS